jgi:hypothetical protein
MGFKKARVKGQELVLEWLKFTSVLNEFRIDNDDDLL